MSEESIRPTRLVELFVIVKTLHIPWCVDTLLQHLAPSSRGILLSVDLCLNFPLLIRTPIFGLRPTLIQYNFILTRSHLQRLYLQMRSYPEVPSEQEFGGWGTIQASTVQQNKGEKLYDNLNQCRKVI